MTGREIDKSAGINQKAVNMVLSSRGFLGQTILQRSCPGRKQLFSPRATTHKREMQTMIFSWHWRLPSSLFCL